MTNRQPLSGLGPWSWAIAIVVVVLLALLVVSIQVGECFDYTEGSGLESYCTSGPAVGVTGVWVVAVVSVVVIGYFTYRLFRSRR